jgi:hypothetical protein
MHVKAGLFGGGEAPGGKWGEGEVDGGKYDKTISYICMKIA